MDDSDNNLKKEFFMFWKIIASSIPFILFGILEDSIMFQLGRITQIPFWKAILIVIIPLSILVAYLQIRFIKK